MENNNLAENNIQLHLEEWSKPEIKFLNVNKATLGSSSSNGSDNGSFSGTECEYHDC